MDTKINIHEAKTHFSEILRRVMNGERFVIARDGKPIALLSPIEIGTVEPRIPGNDSGMIRIMPDFDYPLSEFEV